MPEGEGKKDFTTRREGIEFSTRSRSTRGIRTIRSSPWLGRVHKQRQVRVQKREQRVKRRNAGGTASTHHAACSRPLHKRPCRLAARANERFYNSMQSPPEGPFGLSFSLSLTLCSSSFGTPCRLLFHFFLQPLAPFFGRVACFSPLREDQL